MIKILFVCHGNICRSVAAEFIFKHIIAQDKLDNKYYVESKAISSEELNNDIYPPMKRALIKHNISFTRHFATKITKQDYQNFDYIFVMDFSNLSLIKYIIPEDNAHKIFLIKEFVGQYGEVEDPWYIGKYDEVVKELSECAKLIVKRLEEENKNEN